MMLVDERVLVGVLWSLVGFGDLGRVEKAPPEFAKGAKKILYIY